MVVGAGAVGEEQGAPDVKWRSIGAPHPPSGETPWGSAVEFSVDVCWLSIGTRSCAATSVGLAGVGDGAVALERTENAAPCLGGGAGRGGVGVALSPVRPEHATEMVNLRASCIPSLGETSVETGN